MQDRQEQEVDDVPTGNKLRGREGGRCCSRFANLLCKDILARGDTLIDLEDRREVQQMKLRIICLTVAFTVMCTENILVRETGITLDSSGQ